MASNYPSQIPITDTNADVWEIVSQSRDELVIRPVATIFPNRIDPAVSTDVNIMYNPILDTVLKKT